MKLSDFNYNLPPQLLAQFPTPFRDDAKMMVLHKTTGKIEHKKIRDIINYFDDGDSFVFNDTKVFPAHLKAKKEKTFANIEIFLIRELDPKTRFWDVRVDPARKIRVGNKLFFDDDPEIIAEVIDNTTSRGRTIRFISEYGDDEFKTKLYAIGATPLPNYICRPIADDARKAFVRQFKIRKNENIDEILREIDYERYQTVFAANEGSVVVPAAGTHFSKNLLKMLEIKGIQPLMMTAHISPGIFKTIDVEDLSKFKIDSEQIIIPQHVADSLNKTLENDKKICIIGTEVLRAMEHVTGAMGHFKACNGWTNRFIYPPYTFAHNYNMLVNFYLPMSIRLMTVVAIGGYDKVMHAYDIAIKNKYRFGDYGDAMLIID